MANEDAIPEAAKVVAVCEAQFDGDPAKVDDGVHGPALVAEELNPVNTAGVQRGTLRAQPNAEIPVPLCQLLGGEKGGLAAPRLDGIPSKLAPGSGSSHALNKCQVSPHRMEPKANGPR